MTSFAEGQTPAPKPISPALSDAADRAVRDPRVRQYLRPTRIVWQSQESGAAVEHPEHLLQTESGQVTLSNPAVCVLRNNGKPAGILLDFGKELHGGVQIAVSDLNAVGQNGKTVRLRVRFGESVSEAMSELGDKNAQTDHAVRDQIAQAPWLGTVEVGNTGFRFVRIDLVEPGAWVALKFVRAVFLYRDLPYLGSFRCSDDLLNRIWQTGAYTVHLNMQDYLWDGIKRDRLVWIGDMHPETQTIGTVFGNQDIVPRSLDLIREETPLPGWMNGISSYSLWWVLIHQSWFRQTGDLAYLRQQKPYLTGLLTELVKHIGANGAETLPEGRFLDWPSSENKPAIHAGLHALLILTLQAGAELCQTLDDSKTKQMCLDAAARLKQHTPDPNGSKQAAALMALAGLGDPIKLNRDILAKDGAKRLSTFYGYYVLEARAKAGDFQGAIDAIRQYWGGMLQMGATTFWEDFDLDWMPNAFRIDELPQAGKKDIHGDFGGYCYLGFRHSLCHGWASGPTPWLTEHVLGIQIVEPGCKVIKITPHLGDLAWAEGTFPTPQGVLMVRHEKQADGSIKTVVNAPKGVRVITQKTVEGKPAVTRSNSASVSHRTETNVPIELTFTAQKSHAKPFDDVTLDVVFTDPAGQTRRVPAFWAGSSTWKVRYSSPLAGAHSWRSECNATDDPGLHGVAGNVEVKPYRGTNPLFKRGAIRVAADKRHFEHADGTPFFWLGDTWWMGLCHRLHFPDEFAQLTADRKAKGFNVVQIVAGLYPDMQPFDPRGANEAGFPWEAEYARIRPEYFDMADRRIEYLISQGITPCIVGAWGYFLPWMGQQKMEAHWRYLIARYGAMPVVWCVAGEANLPWYLASNFPSDDRKQAHDWTAIVRFVRNADPFRRPLTIHPTAINQYTARHAADDPTLLDYDMLQTPHGQKEAVPITVKAARDSFAAKPIMPIINGEAAYEKLGDNLPTEWTRAMFWLCVMNGTKGHTYGANGIWQVNRKDQPHGASPHGGNYGKISWDEAMNLPGSEQMGFGKRFMESLPWAQLQPMPESASWETAPTEPEDPLFAPQSCGIGDRQRVVYVIAPRPVVVRGLTPQADYGLTLFDPVTGKRTPKGTVSADAKGEWHGTPPAHGHDWVILLTRSAKTNTAR